MPFGAPLHLPIVLPTPPVNNPLRLPIASPQRSRLRLLLRWTASTEHVGKCRGRGNLLTSLLLILSQTLGQALLLRLHLVKVVAAYSSCSPLMPRSPRRSLSRHLAHPV